MDEASLAPTGNRIPEAPKTQGCIFDTYDRPESAVGFACGLRNGPDERPASNTTKAIC